MPKDFPPAYFYHLVFDANQASILEKGLLSTEALLIEAGYTGPELEEHLRSHRPRQVTLPNGIVLRDQSPMPPAALIKALPSHVSPEDWYRLLNSFVFLWADADRVKRHWLAGGGRDQSLFVFDAPQVLEDLGDRIRLSAINSGNARRNPSPRAPETLVPYLEWRENGWPEYQGKKRPRTETPVEILVEDRMPLSPFLLGSIPTEELRGEQFDPQKIEAWLRKNRS